MHQVVICTSAQSGSHRLSAAYALGGGSVVDASKSSEQIGRAKREKRRAG